jgi:hypothetical protein
MDSTIQSIVAAADLPLSILIVGVGNADFTQMDTLDGDKQRLSYNGRPASRDIVQFVPMRDFVSRSPSFGVPVMADISRALLAEIPDQLLSFMGQHRIVPNPRPSLPGMFATPQMAPSAAIVPPRSGPSGYVPASYPPVGPQYAPAGPQYAPAAAQYPPAAAQPAQYPAVQPAPSQYPPAGGQGGYV